MRPVRYDPAAAQELAEAVAWYEAEHAGLGDALLSEVDAIVAALRSGGIVPHSPVPELADPTVRRILLERFPYAIAFVEHEGAILLVAVAHLKRRPAYWADRLPAPPGR
jgi:plasmid stabilization system protein ParE